MRNKNYKKIPTILFIKIYSLAPKFFSYCTYNRTCNKNTPDIPIPMSNHHITISFIKRKLIFIEIYKQQRESLQTALIERDNRNYATI